MKSIKYDYCGLRESEWEQHNEQGSEQWNQLSRTIVESEQAYPSESLEEYGHCSLSASTDVVLYLLIVQRNIRCGLTLLQPVSNTQLQWSTYV